MTSEQLTAQYLANGGTITKLPAVEPKFEPYEGKLQSTGTKPVYDNYGNRIYQNLDKTGIANHDITTLNYGRDG